MNPFRATVIHPRSPFIGQLSIPDVLEMGTLLRQMRCVGFGGSAWPCLTRPDSELDAQPRDRDVDRAVARIYAARARLEAVQLNRLGEYRDARHALRGVARRIAGYAGSDTELKELAGQLIAEEAAFSAPMPELDRKSAYYRSANVQRSRDIDGQARR